jgi:acyl transferase domain-containing protein/NADPH:quinone reductase-like Zn-dependent oxidoreductase/acyl carrier protein
MNSSSIAIIGMAGRFPGAADVAEFWCNLSGGVESVTFFGREVLSARGVSGAVLNDPLYVGASAVLDGVELFDADFFGFTPREAELTDPQHRIFLECAWQALEDSGYDPASYDDRIGLYAGAGLSTYLINCILRRPDVAHSAGALALQLGNNKDYVPLRASYKLNLTGPSVNVNTACSSSLVAVHMACQSLLDHECEIALAGGVGIQVPQDRGYLYSPNGILSPDGHCRAFDARAAGTVSGNGAGLVVLKRLEEAVADGDTIRAVILGSAVNNDGGSKVGFTAPSVDGQARVISEALAVADVDPATIGYVEAHGTGTPLGDPIEVEALTQVFGSSSAATKPCALGSVKTNVGHLDEAAGVTGLIKTVLALQHAAIPPSLNFERRNPDIDFDRSPFYVPTRLSPWDGRGAPRRAGVSSFGIGGTNAHVVLQEAPPVAPADPSRPWQLLLLSARTESALDALSGRLARHLQISPDLPSSDVAYTLHVARKDFPVRRAIVCRDRDEAVTRLESRLPQSARAASAPRPIVFMFPGQGSQHPQMTRGLYESERGFRETVDRCAELLMPQLGFDLRSVLYPADGQATMARLEQTAIVQPALFTVEYALARLLIGWGIAPQAMIGHSIGEYVAACLAGVFSMEDALSLVAARGRLMQEMPRGAMLAVELAERELSPRLAAGLAIAAVNAPAICVVSGAVPAVQKLQEELAARDVGCHRLHTSHAFHSEFMEPILEAFENCMRAVSLNPPAIPYLSNLTGCWVTAEDATDPGYWVRHVRETVRFSQGLSQLLQLDRGVFLEVGPGQSLLGLVRRYPEFSSEHLTVGSMRPANDRRDDMACLLEAVGQLWTAGACRKPVGYYADEKRRRVPLPTYPFERQRFWIDPPAVAIEEPTTRPVSADANTGVEDWFYVPVWKPRSPRSNDPRRQADRGSCLVFLDTCGLGSILAKRLRHEGRDVLTVMAGDTFASHGEGAYTINPREPRHYDDLISAIGSAGNLPRHFVHLWSVSPPARVAEAWDEAQYRGFFSVLFLVQAAARRQDMTDDMSIDVVSSGMQQLGSGDVSCPEKATLLGTVRVVPLEFPGIRCHSIDLSLHQPNRWEDAGCLDRLIAELFSRDVAPVSAIRGDHVWEQSVAPRRLKIPTAAPVRLRQGGTYLVTGGLGSMGLAFARYLAGEVRANLVLVGRTGLAVESEPDAHSSPGANSARARALAGVDDIRRHGEVLVIPADVADEAQMRAALAQLQQRFGALHGVIHTAGVLGQGLIHGKTRDDAQQVLSPKVLGTLVLDKLLRERDIDLDFLILCSSAASVAPIIGQVDYCAANAFLDAYAASRMGRGRTSVISVDWGFWQELGLIAQARTPDRIKRQIEDEIRAKGRSDAGVQALRCILDQGPPPQVLVLPDGLDQFAPPHAGAPAAPDRQRIENLQHPWLDACPVDTAETRMYVCYLDAAQWVLDEHRLTGKAVLPGTAVLELARAAFTAGAAGRPVQMSDVYFLLPLVVEDNETKEIRIILQRRGADFEFVLASRVRPHADEWREHARGDIAYLTLRPPPPRDLEEIERHCAQTEISTTNDGGSHSIAQRFDRFPLHWRNLTRLRLGSQQGLATLQLAPQFAAETGVLLLHPALADVATGFMSVVDGFENGLPFRYERVLLWKSLQPRVHSHVRRIDAARPDELSYDATVLDDEGEVLLDITGFTLRTYRDGGTEPPQRVTSDAERNFCVEIERPGALAGLGMRPDVRRTPGPGEVEIEVAAAGLNFIEVLYALGMLPDLPGGAVRFGLECAGRIAAVGENVTEFRPGDQVFGFAPGSFSRFTTTNAASVARKPGHLTCEQAATIPAAFATAYYSLITIGRLSRGERVLIHSAAGGVGLAAVNIATWRGAEIFATAGTPEKREYLRRLGIRHVFDSRSLDFAPQVLEATAGKGVDVALNSLGGEFIAASLSVLARYGRFLELGKRDIFGNGALGLAPFARHLTFSAIDVSPDLPDFATLWRDVVQGIRQGDFQTLPLREFPVGRLSDAFEYMAQGRHIGKVVVSMVNADAVAMAPRRGGGRPLEDILRRGASPVTATRSGEQPDGAASAIVVPSPQFAPAHARPALSTPYRPPAGETERKVVEIWQELLGVSGIGADDNFLDLHGDSLLAAQVTSRLYAAFSVKLPLSCVFEHPTTAGLAARIEQLRQSVRELETAPSRNVGEREVEHEL